MGYSFKSTIEQRQIYVYKGDSIYTVAEKLDYLLLLQVMICPSGASQLTYCTDVQVL